MGQGWEACEDNLTLSGWIKSRRAFVMRRDVRGELVAELPKAKRGRKKYSFDSRTNQSVFYR